MGPAKRLNLGMMAIQFAGQANITECGQRIGSDTCGSTLSRNDNG
jgi:hypothetical protein